MAITATNVVYLLNPVDAERREILTRKLDEENITRLTVQRGKETQTLRRDDEGWSLTCSNARV
jgi:hypothetical protein